MQHMVYKPSGGLGGSSGVTRLGLAYAPAGSALGIKNFFLEVHENRKSIR